MPNYDYKCKDCYSIFTLQKSMNDDKQPICPNCNTNNASKIWGSIQLKGCSKTTLTSGGNCGSCTKSSCASCN